MAWFFLGLLTLAIGLGAAELLVRLSPKRLMGVLRVIGLLIAGVVALLLLLGVRSILLGLLTGLALALLSRAGLFAPKRPFSQGNPSQSSANKASEVETAYLRMTLDHATGKLEGEVLAGRWKGRRLSDLSFEQVLMLYEECRAQDMDSIALLEAFLDREFGEAWRDAAGAGNQSADVGSGNMTVEQALNVLGLEAGATEQEIRAAHKRLMKKMHPDQGGSDFLARQINQAKDVLLKSG